MTVVTNEENELVPTRLVTGWRVCIDYRYFQIPIDPKDQEKTNIYCAPEYGTFREFDFKLSIPRELKTMQPNHRLVVTSHDDQNIPWFADIANYHARNFLIKGMTSQQKRKFFKDISINFGNDAQISFEYVQIKSSVDVYVAEKLLKFSKLAMKDPPGAITVLTSQLGKYLMPVFIGLPFIRMPTNLSNLVMLVKDKAKSLNVMRCLKMQSKFVKFSMFGVSNFNDRFRRLGDSPNKLNEASRVQLNYPVRISQKSQENSQKRASTDTRIRRVQKEAKESKPKPENQASVKSSQRKDNHWSTKVNKNHNIPF
ncbi:hypothetical protein Tco_1384590 [Tanacetum coccineum]